MIQIENRELDKWIAENVMGSVPCDKWRYFHADQFINEGCGHENCYPRQSGPPKYSTDISAAFQVVEKMIEDGIQVEIGNHYAGDDWYCIFGGSENLADADTLPLAICLAAKKAIDNL